MTLFDGEYALSTDRCGVNSGEECGDTEREEHVSWTIHDNVQYEGEILL